MIDIKPKPRAFLIENSNRVAEVEVVSESDGMSVVRPIYSNGRFRVRNERLYDTKEEAEEVVKELCKKRVAYNASKPLSAYHSAPLIHPHLLG